MAGCRSTDSRSVSGKRWKFSICTVRPHGQQTVIVVEGYFDCMRVHQAGLPWAVALMGSSLAVAQERTLLQHFDRIVLMVDGDAAGRTASRTIAARLSGRCAVSVVHLPDGAQPDQLSHTAVRRLVENLETYDGRRMP